MSQEGLKQQLADWWKTDITHIEPGKIELRGAPIETLIGETSFAQMIWFMVMGSELTGHRAKLFEAALVAAVDHGPQAPSIAAARMASTCGVGLNNAMATGLNMLGDVHGGAGQQAMELFEQAQDAADLDGFLGTYMRDHGKFLPGFGHRFHKVRDPRVEVLSALVEEATQAGEVPGQVMKTASRVRQGLARLKGQEVPLNIDGITAVVYGELGVPSPLARGFFCLSRSVGILAHAWEQTQQGGRNKGPYPPCFSLD